MPNRNFLVIAIVFAAFVSQGCPAATDVPTADDYLKFVEPYFPGKWTYESTTPDGNVAERGTWDVKMAPHGRCVTTFDTDADGKPINATIDGFDPKAKCWRVLVFRADGSMVDTLVRIDKKTLTAGEHAGAKWKARRTVIASDGSEEVNSMEGKIHDKNSFEIRQVTGDKDERVTIRFTRKK